MASFQTILQFVGERVPWRWRDDVVPFIQAVAQHLPNRLLRELRSPPHRWRRRSAVGCSAAPDPTFPGSSNRRQRLPNSPPPGGSSTIWKCTFVGVSSRRRCWLRMPVRYAMRRSSGAGDNSSRSFAKAAAISTGSSRGGGDVGKGLRALREDLGDRGRSIAQVAHGESRHRRGRPCTRGLVRQTPARFRRRSTPRRGRKVPMERSRSCPSSARCQRKPVAGVVSIRSRPASRHSGLLLASRRNALRSGASCSSAALICISRALAASRRVGDGLRC